MRAQLLTGWFLLLLLASSMRLARADDYSGIYTLQGTKGPITLTLQTDKEGKASGSLKGGDLALQLTGFPQQGGGLLGTAKTAQGQFAWFFEVTKANGQLLFDLLEANADGDPDRQKRTRLPFALAGAGKAPVTPTRGNGNDDEDKEGDDEGNDAADVDDMPLANNQSQPARPNGGTPATAVTGGAFVGTFKSNELTLIVRPEGNDYKGTLKLGEQTFPFTAAAVNGTMHGTFTSGNDRFDFQAVAQGNKLQLTTGETEYLLDKQGAPAAKNPLAKPKSANPLDKPKPAKAPGSTSPKNGTPAPAKSPAPAKATVHTGPVVASNTNAQPIGGPGQNASWKIFKHPIGLSVRYPPSWKFEALPDGSGHQLTPPDVAKVDGGPSEAYIVLGAAAEGITSVEDPRVAPYVEQQVAQLLPTMQRVGEVQTLRSGSQPALSIGWEGQSPSGQKMRAQVLTTILKGYAVTIFSVGVKDKIAARDKTIREVFASLAAGAGQKDQQLVGTWKFWSYKSSADGKFGTETTRFFRLLADGTCAWTNNSESAGNFTGKDSLGNTTWTAGVAGQGGNADTGTWSAGNNQLYVMWKDGSSSAWGYQVGGAPGNRRLMLQGVGKKPDEWVEVR